jgi:hypothetical protein
LTGGDLIATTAVLGSAAFAAGSAAVSGVTALASVGGAAAVGGGSASSAGGTGSVTRSAIASVGSHGAGWSAGGSSVSPPSYASPASGPARRQPDPPLSSSSRSISSTLPSVGGEPLEGSGFEGQTAQRGFAPMSVTGMDEVSTSGAPPSSETAPPSLGTPGSSGSMADIASTGSGRSANPQPPPSQGSTVSRAVDQVLRGMRLRFLSLPSDAAPHNTPPRIPIDHEENP